MSGRENAVRGALRGYAAGLGGEQASSAGAVWLRAERRRRRLAMERAVQPLRVMWGVAVAMAVVALVWALHVSGGAGRVVLVGSMGMVLLMGGGCWAMLQVGRR